MSGSGRDTKLTTFLTHDDGHRAPSAYHVDQHSVSVRARQEHRSGPTMTSEKMRVQAFAKTKEQARIVSDIVKDHVQQTGIDPAMALRLAIADGLVSPTASFGAGHVEASRDKVGKGNPHISGGTVSFPESGSPLSDFTQVQATTEERRSQAKSKTALSAPITTTTTSVLPPQTQAFNEQALQLQQDFMKDLLGSKD